MSVKKPNRRLQNSEVFFFSFHVRLIYKLAVSVCMCLYVCVCCMLHSCMCVYHIIHLLYADSYMSIFVMGLGVKWYMWCLLCVAVKLLTRMDITPIGISRYRKLCVFFFFLFCKYVYLLLDAHTRTRTHTHTHTHTHISE